MGYRFVRILVRVLVWALARVKVEGWENVPKTGSYIAVANHIGRIDPILMYYLLDRNDIIMLVAEKYRKRAFWRFFVRQVNGIFVDRYEADFSAMREVLKRLQKGGVLGIAPEGTRSKSGKLLEGRMGAAFLGAKSGVPILPVGVEGSDDSELIRRVKRLRRLEIRLHVGETYLLPTLKREEREAALEDYTEEMMCRIAALLPEERWGFYAGHPRVNDFIR